MEKFGRYIEGEGVDFTEMDTALRFIHRGGQALFYDDFSSLFYRERTTAETSTRTKPSWRLSGNPLIYGVPQSTVDEEFLAIAAPALARLRRLRSSTGGSGSSTGASSCKET